MKIIPRTSFHIEDAVLLFVTNTNITIWRIGIDQYAITKGEDHELTIAFESSAFSYTIDQLSADVADFAVIGCNCALCNGEHKFIEFRLLLENGTNYYISSNDQVAEVSVIELADRDESPAPTPCHHWQLPEEAPYQNMFITQPLSKLIGGLSGIVSITDVVDRLWLETNKLKTPHLIGKIAEVEGEFFDYAATELRCGRVLLMTPSETNTYSAFNQLS